MEIIGHRGARGLAPENSVKAIKRALSCKVDMIELDLRVQNGMIVLAHDPTTASESYATLAEALKLVGNSTLLNLEIKEMAVLPLLGKEIKKHSGEILFSSFEYKILHALRKIVPNADIAVLEKWSGVRAVAEAALLGTNRVHINHQWLWSGFVRSMKHRGFSLYAYTVNSRDRAEELEEWGIDGIFTDYPSIFS